MTAKHRLRATDVMMTNKHPSQCHVRHSSVTCRVVASHLQPGFVQGISPTGHRKAHYCVSTAPRNQPTVLSSSSALLLSLKSCYISGQLKRKRKEIPDNITFIFHFP